MADTPRVTVPVERAAAHRRIKDFLEYERKGHKNSGNDEEAREISDLLADLRQLSAAPAPEGGAVNVPGGYLVKDFADGWYWAPNADLDHASGAPVWSVADNRYETDPTALATREEAPADHVSDARQMVEAPAEAGKSSLVDWFSRFVEAHQEGCGPDTDALIACLDRVRDSYRAQPQARKEAQPVAWRYRWKDEHHDREWRWAFSKMDATTAELRGYEVRPVFEIPPAPEAENLRAILTQIDFNHDPGEPEGDGYRLIGPAIDQITEALAAAPGEAE